MAGGFGWLFIFVGWRKAYVAGIAACSEHQRKHTNGNDDALGGQPEGNPQEDRTVKKRGIQFLTRSHGSTYLAITGALRHFSINWDACLEVSRSGKVSNSSMHSF